MKINGYVEIHVKDKDTMETLEVIKSKNVVTDYIINLIFSGSSGNSNKIGPNIGISSDTSPQSRFYSTGATPAQSPTLLTGYVAAGVVSPNWVEKNGAVSQYVEFQQRFDPPATTRSINTIFLTNYTTPNFGSAYNYHAYTLLASTCTQTTTQILDVFYRIEFPYSVAMNVPESTYRSIMFSKVFGGANGTGYYMNGATALPIPVLSQSVNDIGALSDTSEFALNRTLYTGAGVINGVTAFTALSANVFGSKLAWGLAASELTGRIFNTVIVGATNSVSPGSITYVVEPISWSPVVTSSEIQPVFSHSSTATGPFFNVATLASGSGSVVASGVRTIKHFPEIYSINIVAGGNVGVSTYTFSKRKTVGVAGDTYLDNATYVPALMAGISGTYNTAAHGITDQTQDCVKYDSQTVLYFDATGVTKYDLANAAMTHFDSTTTPSLPVTAVKQIAVGTDGTIWVACAATGLWSINSVGTVVTHITTPTGVTTTNCYAVDIGFGGAICALFNGGYCISTTNGATWTTYNPTSVPAFTFTGITDANWSTVLYIKVDPQSANFNTLFVRDLTTTVLPTTGSAWWSTLGTTSAGPDLNYARSYRYGCDVSDNTSFWAGCLYNTAGTVTNVSLTFGLATTTVIYTQGLNNWAVGGVVSHSTKPNGCIQFEHNSITNADALIIFTGQSFPTSVPTGVALYNPNGTSTTSVALAGKVGGSFGPRPSYINLGNGMMFYRWWNPPSISLAFRGAGVLNWTSDATPAGGPLSDVFIENYGWSGNAWVLGSNIGKPTHLTTDSLDNGLTVSFVEGTAPGVNSFVATDYYTYGVCSGVLKDNATTMTYSNNVYYKSTVNTTDFTPSTITSIAGNVGAPTWGTLGSGTTIDVSNRLVVTSKVANYLIGAQSTTKLLGDFKVDFTSLTGVNNFYVGVGVYDGTDALAAPSATSVSFLNNFFINANVYQYMLTNRTYPAAVAVPTTLSIQRVGTTITYLNNGVVVYTAAGSYAGPMRINMAARDIGAGPFTSPVVTIASNGSMVYSNLGNPATFTGVYDAGFIAVETDTPALTKINLDGNIAANTYLITGTVAPSIPNVGEVAVYSQEGIAVFNAADVGKTITGNYTIIRNT